MNKDILKIFDMDTYCKNKCGVFKIRKDTYLLVPLINKNVILNSFNLYNPTNVIKKIYKKVIVKTKAVVSLKFIYQDMINYRLKDYLVDIFKNIKDVECFSIYTGTPGKNSKYTVQLMDCNGKVLGYAKVSKNEYSKQIIQSEANNLKYVNTLNLKHSIVPKNLFYDKNYGVLIQSTEENIKDSNFNLADKEILALSEIYQFTRKKYKLKDSIIYQHILKLKEVESEKIKSAVKRVLEYFENNSCIEKKYWFCYAHKDFASWNLKYKEDKLYIFDWEMAEEAGAYFDVFHHIYFARLQVSKWGTVDILKEIANNEYIDKFEKITGLSNRKFYLGLYVLEKLYYYIICNFQKGDKENIEIKSCIEMINIIF